VNEWSGTDPEYAAARARLQRAANDVEDTLISLSIGLKIAVGITVAAIVSFAVWMLILAFGG